MLVPTFVLEGDLSPEEVLEGIQDLFALEPSERADRRITYLDTFDWRLWSRGLVLTSVAGRGGVHLILRGNDGSVWETRTRVTPAFASDLPRIPIREVLEPAAGIRRLLGQASARWQTERYALKNEDDKTVVRAQLRRGRASAPGSRASEPLPPRLELLPLKGYEPELRKVVARLRRCAPQETSPAGELSAVMASLGEAPGAYSSSFRLLLDPEARAGEAARAIHAELLQTMVANLEGVLRDLDPEFLHDFRVAVRRARSALAEIKGVFPDGIVDRYARELRWLGERTGPVRDLDVYLLKIPVYRSALSKAAADQLDPLVDFLERKKKIAHRRMVRSLTSQRFGRLVSGWKSALDAADEDEGELPQARRLAREIAAERIAKAHWKVLKRGRKTDRKTSPETLHRLRIDCKKLRYLMTLFQSLFSRKELMALVKETKRLQDALGDFNDLYVQRSALLSFAGEMMSKGTAPPATLMAMGQLMGGMEAQQAAERERFHESFQRFSRKRNRARFEALFDGPPSAERPSGANTDLPGAEEDASDGGKNALDAGNDALDAGKDGSDAGEEASGAERPATRLPGEGGP